MDIKYHWSGIEEDWKNKDHKQIKKEAKYIMSRIDKYMIKANTEVIENIIDALNEMAGTNFRSTTKSHIRHINARLKEGYCLDDFINVIEVKCFQWLNNPKMTSYLRPSTLFNSEKFPGYVEEAKRLRNTPELRPKNNEPENWSVYAASLLTKLAG